MYAPHGPYFAFISDLLPTNVAGQSIAFINSCGALGAFAGTYLVGLLQGRTGNSQASLWHSHSWLCWFEPPLVAAHSIFSWALSLSRSRHPERSVPAVLPFLKSRLSRFSVGTRSEGSLFPSHRAPGKPRDGKSPAQNHESGTATLGCLPLLKLSQLPLLGTGRCHPDQTSPKGAEQS